MYLKKIRKVLLIIATLLIFSSIVILLIISGFYKRGNNEIANSKIKPRETENQETNRSIESKQVYGESEDAPSIGNSSDVSDSAKSNSKKKATDEEFDKPKSDVLKNYKNLGVVTNIDRFLNIRSSPDVESESIGKILLNGGIDILETTDNGWYKIESNGVSGYVNKKYIATGKQAEKLAIEHATYMVRAVDETMDVYKYPSVHSDVLASISNKSPYPVLRETANFFKIPIFASTKGYVKKSCVTGGYQLEGPIMCALDDSVSEQRKNLVNLAWQYYGGKYVWGGTELGVGVDCSGYVMRLYEKIGILISRVTWDQINDGISINEEQMRPGDLIFYCVEGDFVDHVAMYIGSNKIIHAASENRGITVNEWDYLPVVGIRNIIGDL